MRGFELILYSFAFCIHSAQTFSDRRSAGKVCDTETGILELNESRCVNINTARQTVSGRTYDHVRQFVGTIGYLCASLYRIQRHYALINLVSSHSFNDKQSRSTANVRVNVCQHRRQCFLMKRKWRDLINRLPQIELGLGEHRPSTTACI